MSDDDDLIALLRSLGIRANGRRVAGIPQARAPQSTRPGRDDRAARGHRATRARTPQPRATHSLVATRPRCGARPLRLVASAEDRSRPHRGVAPARLRRPWRERLAPRPVGRRQDDAVALPRPRGARERLHGSLLDPRRVPHRLAAPGVGARTRNAGSVATPRPTS